MKIPTLVLGLLLGAVGVRWLSPPPQPPNNERGQLVDGKYLVYATDYGVQLYERDGDSWRSKVDSPSEFGKKTSADTAALMTPPHTVSIGGSDLLIVPEFHLKGVDWSKSYKFYRLAGTKLVRVPVTDEDK